MTQVMSSNNSQIRLILTLVGGWIALFSFLFCLHVFAYTTRASGPNRFRITDSAPVVPGTFYVTYYDTSEPSSDRGSGIGDNLIDLINPTAANGNVCAMIYVFDTEEELGECCGCQITPNQLEQLSVEANLTQNWGIAGATPGSGVIAIAAAPPNQSLCGIDGCTTICNPTIDYVPTPNLAGYTTHNQLVTSTSGLTEVPLFDVGAADAVELQSLVSDCELLTTNGTGTGVCSCPSLVSQIAD